MNWRNVKLVWHRELRDQLRDRRSLFMVAVLPVLLYPMLGATIFQLAGFLRDHQTQVLVVGAEQLDDFEPPLFVDGAFAPTIVPDRPAGPATKLRFQESASSDTNRMRQNREQLSRGDVDVIVHFPPEFGKRLAALRSTGNQGNGTASEPPRPIVKFNSANEASQVGQRRVEAALDVWKAQMVRDYLAERNVPQRVANPLQVVPEDVALPGGRQARMWSRLLPFVVFVWALTGAFYPAVDLCAGEKERGTLEALLSSPALRSEIVSGKLLTVITFSIASAVANLASMALTGKVLIDQLNAMSTAAGDSLSVPSFAAVAWLLVALLPMATLFSALSLAVAAFARSTKEGQYYLMPLLLGCLPLMVLPITPNVELNLGTSLIPITGMVLLLRSAIEGNMAVALPYVPVVAAVTLGCCWVAIRWAVMQFNSESVLFRESENFTLGLWLRKLYTDRPDLPAGGAAVACIAAIYFVQFITRSLGGDITTPFGITRIALISQACIIVPALLLALLLSRQPRMTLRLRAARRWWHLPGAVLLAALIHPVAVQLMVWIVQMYPPPEELSSFMEELADLPLPLAIVLFAIIPPICEELAYRGFVLTGLRRSLNGWAAVLISALAFGFAHGFLQQSISASVLGVILGWLALRTGSIWPCLLFHATHNCLLRLRVTFHNDIESLLSQPGLSWISSAGLEDQSPYSPIFTSICAVLAGGLLWAICRDRSTQAKTELARTPKVMPATGEKNG